MVAELDASGNILGRYVRGDAPDEIITGYTSSDPTARGWYHLDQRGSVVAVTDPNGTVTVINRYDEYGQPQGGNYGTFQYTGQMWLGEIGVYNYKNRMYWPNERPGGRFMQTDPVGYGPGMNRYVYVNGNPVNAVDPSGTEGRAFSGIDADDRFPSRDFTPQGTGWGRHSYDWMGGSGYTEVDQQLDLQARAAAQLAAYTHGVLGCSNNCLVPASLATAASAGTDQAWIRSDVLTALKTGQFGGIKIDWYLREPLEQKWLAYPNGQLFYYGTGGATVQGNLGVNRIVGYAPGYIAIIHTHPFWAEPEPGKLDYKQSVPIYGLTPNGAWIIYPGSHSFQWITR